MTRRPHFGFSLCLAPLVLVLTACGGEPATRIVPIVWHLEGPV